MTNLLTITRVLVEFLIALSTPAGIGFSAHLCPGARRYPSEPFASTAGAELPGPMGFVRNSDELGPPCSRAQPSAP